MCHVVGGLAGHLAKLVISMVGRSVGGSVLDGGQQKQKNPFVGAHDLEWNEMR